MGHRILIVDDSAITRAMIKRIIRMTDLPPGELFEAPDGNAALALLGKSPVDLILADLNMPEMDGFEMTRRIRADERTRHIPVVIISASPSADEFARNQQINGCLHKPFTPEAVREVILQALEVSHA